MILYKYAIYMICWHPVRYHLITNTAAEILGFFLMTNDKSKYWKWNKVESKCVCYWGDSQRLFNKRFCVYFSIHEQIRGQIECKKKKTWQCIDLKIKLVKWWSSFLNFQYCWLKSYLLCLKVCFDNIITSGKQYKREENEQS